MRLDSFNGIENTHRTIQNRQAAVNLEPEVLMTWSINKVHRLRMTPRRTIFLQGPVESDCGGLNSDASFPLKREEISDSVTMVNVWIQSFSFPSSMHGQWQSKDPSEE
jgi:hypothetical protein